GWAAMVGVVLGGLGVMAGCAADPDDSLAAQQATTTAVLVTVPQSEEEFPPNGVVSDVLAIDNNFVPAALTVEAGTEVVFLNNGRNDHNVVPPDDLTVSEWGVLDADFMPGDTYSHVFTKPGTYVYVCTIHGTATAGMFGTIVVTAP
ncbi:MAG: plastocyanin/azurin family copper-binding protein, partial [Actinomycetota bacterium]|nr:plastocyanin/azurin family copper-binding protein [Actinomycetota bacterium]